MTVVDEGGAQTVGDDWFGQPMRWLQINLAPDDPLHVDVAGWKQFWEEARVEGLTLSAAGAMAFYPTEVPLHPRSPFLGSRDVFGELVAAAKEVGMRVLARFESGATTPEMAAAHPEWIAKRAAHGVWRPQELVTSGTPSPARPSPCFNGPYFREFMPEVMEELATRYPIDGFYANAWPYIGGGPPGVGSCCSCESCRAGWRARGHDAYPERVDPEDPLWNDFVEFVQESYEDVQRLWQRHVKAIRPGLSFVCSMHGSLSSGVRWREFEPLVDLFVTDSQARHTLEPPIPGVASHALWSPSRRAAIFKAVAGDKHAFQDTGGWHNNGPRLRRLAKAPLEITTMLAQGLARGLRPWCNVAGGTIHDRRWMAPIREFYRWHATAEHYLCNERSLAEVGIVWTPRALWPEWSDPRFRGAGPSLVAAFHGWHEALLRDRRPFDVVPDFRAPALDLDRYQVLVVPSGSAVDAATSSALREFVERGGGLVLGCGVLHPALGLAGGEHELSHLAGVTVASAPEGPHRWGYIELTTTRTHPLLSDVGDTDYVPAGDWHTALELGGASGAGRYQRPLPFPSELAYDDEAPPDNPMLTQHGACISLATDIDALHGEHLLPDARRLLLNCLTVACGANERTCTVTGPGFIDVNVREQAHSTTVHLVNFTNPQVYGGPIDEMVAVGQQRVRLLLRPDEHAVHAQLLRAGRSVPFHHENGAVIVEIPTVTDYEVLAVDRASMGAMP